MAAGVESLKIHNPGALEIRKNVCLRVLTVICFYLEYDSKVAFRSAY
jgi:hypothetical protein